MLKFSLYPLFLSLGIFLIAYGSYLKIRSSQLSRKKALLFFGLSFLGLFGFSKLLGSLGFWITLGDFFWGPSSILGFYVLQIFYWHPWAKKQGPLGKSLLKRWALLNPAGQAIGRIGCYFAGCCYIKDGYSLSWPLLEALYLGLLCLYIATRREELPPAKLYKTYLYVALIGRFFLDFLRGDLIRGSLGVFSFPQIVCALLIICLFLDSQWRKGHNSGHEIRSRKSRRP
ncbi:MAG: prolipoprotein diacylglyceryl transferase [Bdellovibrionota bacterium]